MDAVSTDQESTTPFSLPPPPRKHAGKLGRFLLMLIAVVLPIYTLALESIFRLCAGSFFDPIPTLLHVFLVALLPAANLCAIRAVRGKRPANGAVGFLLGSALVIGTVYSILFIPIAPYTLMYAVASIFLAGLVLPIVINPIVPMLGTIGTVILISRVKPRLREAGKKPWRSITAGAVAASLLILWAEGPRTATRIALERSIGDNADTESLSFLRRFGDQETLLRASYGELTQANDFVGWIQTMSIDSLFAGRWNSTYSVEGARELFYRVSGQQFNTVKRSRWSDPRRSPLMWFNEGDTDLGGERVGGLAEGVSLVSSTMDGSIDRSAGTTYTEWTLIFTNRSARNQEARAELLLPPGGYVTRATLWINGEEREAAFGGRAQVRQAYERVVRGSRDPLLVTTAGRDRALVQCFPIAPNGGEMKVRIGITAPLDLAREDGSRFLLPAVVDKNFSVGAQLVDAVWFESDARLGSSADQLVGAELEAGRFTLRGSPAFKVGRQVEVRVEPGPAPGESWAKNPWNTGATFIHQRFVERKSAAVDHLVIVVDGSQPLAEQRETIAKVIANLPVGVNVAAFVAGDAVVKVAPGFRAGTTESLRELAHAVRDFDFEGGADNIPALRQAWDLLSPHRNGAVLWIHGPQPVRFRTIEALEQQERRLGRGPRMISVELVAGPDRITGSFTRATPIDSVRAVALRPEEVSLRVNTLLSERAYRTPVREEVPAPEATLAAETNDHLVRLWAASMVERALARGTAGAAQAMEIAVRYRLVTAVSGAVVLETAADYKAAGLEEPAAATPEPKQMTFGQGLFPVVPEPELVVLAVVALLLLLSWAAAVRRGAEWASIARFRA